MSLVQTLRQIIETACAQRNLSLFDEVRIRLDNWVQDNTPFIEFWFVVRNPKSEDVILYEHFSKLIMEVVMKALEQLPNIEFRWGSQYTRNSISVWDLWRPLDLDGDLQELQELDFELPVDGILLYPPEEADAV